MCGAVKISTCDAKMAISSSKDEEEQTPLGCFRPDPPDTRDHDEAVANSHFSNSRISRGYKGCLELHGITY